MKTYIFRKDSVRITVRADNLEEAYHLLEIQIANAKTLGIDVGSDIDFELSSSF